MKYQDGFGNVIKHEDIKSDEEAIQFTLYASIQEIGDLLGLEGKFRMQYGTNQIKERIENLLKWFK